MAIDTTLKKLVADARKFFSQKKPVKPKVSPTGTQSDVDDKIKTLEKEFQNRLDTIQGISQNDETLIFTINNHIFAFGEVYRSIGFYYGDVGTRDYQILSSTTTHAQRITSLVRAKVQGRIDALDASARIQDLKQEDQKSLCENNAKFLLEIEEEEREDDKSFNSVQGWMYVLFGFIMILSDITVSLNLVNFFGIGDNNNSGTGLWNKVKDLELLFFSLGIAFCTVYVKILYDDYVNSKIGSGFILRKKFIEKGMTETALKWESGFKGVIKVVILCGLLWFLFSLAQFRAFHTKNDIIAVHSSSTSASDGDITGPVTGINKAPDLLENQKANEQDRYLLYSFIGISLMIPLISGISLSVGFRIFQRRRMLNKAQKMLEESERALKNIHSDLEDLNSRKAEFGTFYKEWEPADIKTQNIATFFANSYSQGFRDGYRKKFGNDLYVLVEDFRNEYVNMAFLNALVKSQK
jgi:hypothetical protein